MKAEERLLAAYTALRQDNPSAALELLGGLELPPAQQARVHAFRGQALRALGRPEEAAREVISAIRLAKQLGDAEGVATLRALHAEISASVASVRAAEAGRAADAPLRATPETALDSDTLLRKSGAHLDAGEVAEAERVARIAIERATNARDSVLARLAMARITRDAAWVHEAHAEADAADDQNLLTAVAHAARALGVRFAPPSFG